MLTSTSICPSLYMKTNFPYKMIERFFCHPQKPEVQLWVCISQLLHKVVIRILLQSTLVDRFQNRGDFPLLRRRRKNGNRREDAEFHQPSYSRDEKGTLAYQSYAETPLQVSLRNTLEAVEPQRQRLVSGACRVVPLANIEPCLRFWASWDTYTLRRTDISLRVVLNNNSHDSNNNINSNGTY